RVRAATHGGPLSGRDRRKDGREPARRLAAPEGTQSRTPGDGPGRGYTTALRGGPERDQGPAQLAQWILGRSAHCVQRGSRTRSSQRNENYKHEEKKEKS